VVAMGYTRQAAALGVVMLSFNAFADRRPRRFLILLGVATLFHTSAVALAPMVLFIGSGKQLSRRAAALVGAGSLILLGGLESLDRYLYSYIEREYEGEGIFYRLPLDLLAAALFFFFRKRWAVRYNDNPLNAVFSLMSLALIPLIFVSTVIADRVGLYLLPFQAAVFSRVPHALARSPLGAPAFLGVAASLAAMLYIWLNYANHAMCWVPYNSLLG
ncbi:MAG TPA: EpsG family protein, partial [Caulobacteraceae bacterium]|nr:EpsG family protein [Caulobacteraceae bacterium]